MNISPSRVDYYIVLVFFLFAMLVILLLDPFHINGGRNSYHGRWPPCKELFDLAE